MFSGDEVTLIAKWRDYQYIIKYNVKYSDKNTTTGTMADQPAPFGQNVQLTPCGYSREGYTFAGWAESSYGSTVKYADGATINRPFEEGDSWDDGSEDGETYNLYAVWTESKSRSSWRPRPSWRPPRRPLAAPTTSPTARTPMH